MPLTQVRRQVQKQWHLREMYTGFGVTWLRTIGLMTTYFILVDSYRRHFPELFSRPLLGPFLMSGVAATLAWWVVWPLEYMKSQVRVLQSVKCQFGRWLTPVSICMFFNSFNVWVVSC